MLDVTVVILTFNEELHIQRCIEKARAIASEIFVVDSYSTDRTADIARSLGAGFRPPVTLSPKEGGGALTFDLAEVADVGVAVAGPEEGELRAGLERAALPAAPPPAGTASPLTASYSAATTAVPLPTAAAAAAPST